MARKRRKSRPGRSRRNTPGPGTAAIMCSVVAAIAWIYTVWTLYEMFIRRRHVHFQLSVVLVDVVFLALTIWLTIEWRRTRRS